MKLSAITFAVTSALVLGSASLALAQSAASADPTEAGKAVFKRANCVGCHKWHGNGGGGYGGDALSLRRTQLTRDQIIETVTCGRPGTGMPYFARGSYDTAKCYGMSRQDVGERMPPEGGVFLRPNDIEAVADYVLAHIKGRGEPTYDECTAFFGNTSRVCDIYKANATKPASEPSK
ncbi:MULTISPECIES: c-type cytochrome [unclassified Bradyrhizobium]|uniref:c-type cytochrome n=1 Tax=unclassified Bradyrhizobium TaxID=2631580 RepID=UPI0028EE1F71|nr:MULTISPECIES: c-type cytochrome [unclassified Bradyrhizobium]